MRNSYAYLILIFMALSFISGCKSNPVSHQLTLTVHPQSPLLSVSKQSPIEYVDRLSKMEFNFHNGTSESIDFGYETCGYYEHWKTDSTSVVVPNWPCRRNIGAIKKSLKPGESFKDTVPIFISSSALRGVTTFHMTFTPGIHYNYPLPGGISKPLGEFVSNEIQIQVVE